LLVAETETMQALSGSGGPDAALPPDALIILPVRSTVLFPGLVLPIAIGRPRSVAAA
jgi:ATP-dependent Lon protease